MLLGCLALLSAASASAAAPAAAAASKPAATQGVRHVPAFDLPVSEYLSPAARAQVSGDVDRGDPLAKADNATLLRQLPTIRADTERWAAGVIAQMRTRYAVEITPEQWNGVPVLRVQPRTRTPEQAKRLLIELHGGGFVMGSAASFGLMEAIPVAAMTGITVVAVDYRMGPEHQFPRPARTWRGVSRRSQDLHPGAVGPVRLFGRWRAHRRGAGVVCQGTVADAGGGRPVLRCGRRALRGDSQRVVAAVNDALLPDVAGTLPIMEDLYYGPDVDFRDPLVSPVFSDAVLRQFPPTLLITATRAAELSNASYTHARLVDLGRESDLHVWDGLGHAFHLTDTLPESQQALRVMARFFSKHLGLPPPPLPASR